MQQASLNFEAARELGEQAAQACLAKAQRSDPLFSQRAATAILNHLRAVGQASGEELVDIAIASLWKSISEFPGSYEISSVGLVRSLVSGRVLSIGTSNSGYAYVSLYSKNKSHSRFVHRLMAEAFLADFDKRLQVNHIDGNKKNNSLCNLEMVTPRENLLHSIHVLGNRSRFHDGFLGANNGFSKPVLQLSRDGALVRRFECRMDAVREGFNASCITECCNGTQKTHGGYLWSHV